MNINLGGVLILTHWSYNDALVQAYTLPYVRIIRRIVSEDRKIVVVTSEQIRLALKTEEVLSVNKVWAPRNMALIATPYQAMGIKKIIGLISHLYRLYQVVRNENITTIHAFCTPAGSIGYLLSKLTGARLVIDSYEPHAESMVENGTWRNYGIPFLLLFFMEKLQTHHGSYFIAASKGMFAYASTKYGKKLSNFAVKPACVDLQKFGCANQDPRLAVEFGLEKKIVCVYAGKLGGIYLKDEVFDFILVCYKYWGDKFRFLMLSSAARSEIDSQIRRTNLPGEVIIHKYVRHSEIPRYLSLGDFAINPVKPLLTKKFCTSIKDGEYWAAGLPVVITKNISDDSNIIAKNNIGYVLEELTNTEYFNAVSKINDLMLESPCALRVRVRSVARRYRDFAIASEIYKTVYDT